MSKPCRNVVPLVVVFVVMASALMAQVPPSTINFQGRLTDNSPSQTPVNGTVPMKFAIWDSGSGGTQLWQEPASGATNVTVTNGIFSVVLGSSVPISASVFSGATSTRYLEITINPATTPEVLAPRQIITSTAYSDRAANFSGALAGDVTGTQGATSVVNIRGVPIASTAPTSGQVMQFNGSNWGPATPSGGKVYTGSAPVNVDNSANTIGLNAGTNPNDLMTWDGNNWVSRQPAVQHFTLDNRQPYLCVSFVIALNGMYPTRSDLSNPTIGEIDMFAGNFAPLDWAFCNGQLLAIQQYQALYSILGTTYGGNGSSTFGLPNLQGRVPMHWGSGTGLSTYVIGQSGGSETVTR